jgi:hypothetical protein
MTAPEKLVNLVSDHRKIIEVGDVFDNRKAVSVQMGQPR